MKNTNLINSEIFYQAKKNKFEVEVDDGENVFKVEVEVSDDEELLDIKPTITEEISVDEVDSCTSNDSVLFSKCHICGFNIEEVYFRAHLKDHYIKKQECHLCERQFENILRYKRHILEDHKQKKLYIYRCKKCDTIFRFGSHYKMHLLNLHGIKLFAIDATPEKKKKKGPPTIECGFCGLEIVKSGIMQHRLLIHTCKICGLKYKNVKLHMQRSHAKTNEPNIELSTVEELDVKPLIADVPQIESLFADVPEVKSLIVEEPKIEPETIEELDIKPLTIEENEIKFSPDEEIVEKKINLSILNSSTDNKCNIAEVQYPYQKTVDLSKRQCKLCNLEFKSIIACETHILEIHEKQKDLNARYCCKKCNIPFKLASLFKSHVEKMHSNDEDTVDKKTDELKNSYMREKCTICGLLVRKVKLNDHILSHERIKRICEICGKLFANINGHIQHVHSNLGYTCKKCGRTFTRLRRYNYHLNAHLGIRNHVCKTCGKCFITASGLTKHTLGTHLKLRAFTCEVCNKAFSSNFALRTHKRQHTNETPFRCEECGDAFKHNVSLKAHRKSKHNISEPKICPCPVCGKKFPSKQAIDTHMRIH